MCQVQRLVEPHYTPQTDAALSAFMKLLIPVTNKHAPIKTMTVKTVKSPWIYKSPWKMCMVERDEAKGTANKSGSTSDWQTYCKLRNHVTKLNKKKKKLHYETKINDTNTSIIIFFIVKISKLRHEMPATNTDTTHPSISEQIMKYKHCHFGFHKVNVWKR